MIQVLVVEDEKTKKQLIAKAIVERAGLPIECVAFSDNVRDAKILLSKRRFDLLILDINIPKSSERESECGAGLDVLSFISRDARCRVPTYVLGLTAYDEAFSAATDAFSNALWKLVRFSYQDGEWEKSLVAAIEHLVSHEVPPYRTDGSTHHYDVGIVVALDEELDPILRLPFSWERLAVPTDQATYHKGVIFSGDDQFSVVATAAPKMGMPAMGIAATKLVEAFHPKYLVTSGICAGVRDKTAIGDVLVADPCFDWGSGKWRRSGKDGAAEFHPAQYQWRLNPEISSKVSRFVRNAEYFQEVHSSFPGKKSPVPPQLHVDAMASGAAVIQLDQFMTDIRRQHKNLIGVEMENYAVFCAAEYASLPRPHCIALKAVCDFGDEEKEDDYHAYAAYVSARVLHRFLIGLIQEPLG